MRKICILAVLLLGMTLAGGARAQAHPLDRGTVEIVAKNFQGLDKGIIKQSLGWLTFDTRYSKARSIRLNP